MILCAELIGTHGGHAGRACYNLIAAALLLPSKGPQGSFFKVFSFSLLLKVRKEVPAEKKQNTTDAKEARVQLLRLLTPKNLLQAASQASFKVLFPYVLKGQLTLFYQCLCS